MLWQRDGSRAWIAVISGRRPEAPKEPALAGLSATWYVPFGESAAYLGAGATAAVESGAFGCVKECRAGRCAARRGALYSVVEDCELPAVFSALSGELNGAFVGLVGVAPTSNAFYFNPRKPVRDGGFVVGDLFAADASCIRFDPNLRLKEDYDFTLQHMQAGIVRRVDWVLATFRHESNPGGAVSYRTSEAEEAAIAYLLAKWPGRLVKNPRRENQLLINLR